MSWYCLLNIGNAILKRLTFEFLFWWIQVFTDVSWYFAYKIFLEVLLDSALRIAITSYKIYRFENIICSFKAGIQL